MQHLIFGILVALAIECRTNVILIDHVSTERTQFCVGEELTLLCKNNTLAYEWVYPGGTITVTQGANAIRSANEFTARYVNATTTTLQFVVSSYMNGITITCTNVFGAINISATNVEVFGVSSMMCPGDIYAIVKDNCRHIDVLLLGVSRCTREYSATITGKAHIISSVLNNTDRGAEMIAIGSFNAINSSLELCITYNVSVTVTFFDGSSKMCSPVTLELPTNSPTDPSMSLTTISSAIPTTSIQRSLSIVLSIVVAVIYMLVIGIFIIIIMICCIRCKKKKKSKK